MPERSVFTVTPAKAGVHGSADALLVRWIPAFAGMTRTKRHRRRCCATCGYHRSTTHASNRLSRCIAKSLSHLRRSAPLDLFPVAPPALHAFCSRPCRGDVAPRLLLSNSRSMPERSVFTVTPAKAGVHGSADALLVRWIPAFAGMTRTKRHRRRCCATCGYHRSTTHASNRLSRCIAKSLSHLRRSAPLGSAPGAPYS